MHCCSWFKLLYMQQWKGCEVKQHKYLLPVHGGNKLLCRNQNLMAKGNESQVAAKK